MISLLLIFALSVSPIIPLLDKESGKTIVIGAAEEEKSSETFTIKKFDEADKSNFLTYDIGTYYPVKGISNSEIASVSRSQHKSQGFGNTSERGKSTEYIELIKGSYPENGNIFEGINTTWSRVKGGKKIGKVLKEVEENYDFEHNYFF